MSVNALPYANFFNNALMQGADAKTQLPLVNLFNNNPIGGGYSNVYAQQMGQMQNMFKMQNMMQYQQMMQQQQMLNMQAFNAGRAHADNVFQNAAFLAQIQTPGLLGLQQSMGCNHIDYVGMLGGFNPMTMMGVWQQPMMSPMMGGWQQPMMIQQPMMMQQPMMVPVQTMQMMPVMTAGGYGAGGGFNAGLGGLFNGLSGLLNGTIGLAGKVLKMPFQLAGGILSEVGVAGQTAKA